MNIKLKAKDFVSIPNLLSYLRLILIPVIIWAYCEKGNGLLTVAFVALSGLTDVLDGKIARRFNMVTDFGKVIDPIADKLTQAALLYCLMTKYELMIPAFIILVAKEIFMAVTALLEVKYSKQINSALWYGKACTTILYIVMLILLFFTDIPLAAANILIVISIAAMIISTVLYGVHRFKRVSEIKKQGGAEK